MNLRVVNRDIAYISASDAVALVSLVDHLQAQGYEPRVDGKTCNWQPHVFKYDAKAADDGTFTPRNWLSATTPATPLRSEASKCRTKHTPLKTQAQAHAVKTPSIVRCANR